MPELCFVKSYVHVAVAPPERVPTPPPLLAGISKNLDEFEPVCHLRALTSARTIVEPPHALSPQPPPPTLPARVAQTGGTICTPTLRDGAFRPPDPIPRRGGAAMLWSTSQDSRLIGAGYKCRSSGCPHPHPPHALCRSTSPAGPPHTTATTATSTAVSTTVATRPPPLSP